MRGLEVVGAFALMSCVAPQTGEPPIPDASNPSGATCDAAPAQRLIGQAASQALGAQALRLAGAQELRWIGPGQAVTQDYRVDRLNLHLDSARRLVRIDCG